MHSDIHSQDEKKNINRIATRRTMGAKHRHFRTIAYLIMPSGVAGAPITVPLATPRLCRSMLASQPSHE
jgi:hypothetical protein